jgi:hypothetical protein
VVAGEEVAAELVNQACPGSAGYPSYSIFVLFVVKNPIPTAKIAKCRALSE